MSDRCPFVLPDSRRCTEKSGHIVSHRWISDEEANWRQMGDTIEKMAAEFHEIYQQEAKRQGDVRHKDAYTDLPENVKEFDRVLARHVAAGIAEAVKAAEEATRDESAKRRCEWCARGLSLDGGMRDMHRGDGAEIGSHLCQAIDIRSVPTGALDRYVASKVREAKIAAYERCERASYGSKIIALLFNEWAAAERKKKGSQNVNP